MTKRCPFNASSSAGFSSVSIVDFTRAPPTTRRRPDHHLRGLEGLRAGWRDFLGAFETISIHPERDPMGGDGECVVEFVRLTGKPKGIDAEIESGAGLWRFRDGARDGRVPPRPRAGSAGRRASSQA